MATVPSPNSAYSSTNNDYDMVYENCFFLGIGNIDLDSKDKIEELKNTVSYLGKQNEQLKNRVSFLFLLVLFFL